jgi:hypothetical protein
LLKKFLHLRKISQSKNRLTPTFVKLLAKNNFERIGFGGFKPSA